MVRDITYLFGKHLLTRLAAWISYTSLFTFITRLSNEDFFAFVNPDNHLTQLMIAHMFLLDCMLGLYNVQLTDRTRFGIRKSVVLAWVDRILEALPVDMLLYAAWAREYAATLKFLYAMP